jgi:hypothetical protein
MSDEQGYRAGCSTCDNARHDIEMLRAELVRMDALARERGDALRDMTFDADGVPTCWPNQERVMALLAQGKP